MALNNMAINGLANVPLQKLGLDLRNPQIGGITVELTTSTLLGEREELQRELVNQWFLMYYVNFEFFFLRLCKRAYQERDFDRPESRAKITGAWEGKFCKVGQDFKVQLGRSATKPWMAKQYPNIIISGEVLDDPAQVLDSFRKVRNCIMHNNSRDENDVFLQANVDGVTFMLLFLAELSGLVEKAFVKEFDWKLEPA